MDHATQILPEPPASLFLVGVGGMGMSALAQLLLREGYTVAGSDRDLHSPGRTELLGQLARMGVSIWPQDGSGVRESAPTAIVTSSAIEADNPDLAAATALPQLPRARALAGALNRLPGRQIAVAGSCGKTSVTAWLDSALRALGLRTLTVCGGYMVDHESTDVPGNFASDPDPEWLVCEVDESDGSLVEYSHDYGVVLNIGTDHFERDELTSQFGRFLARSGAGAVIPDDLRALLGGEPPGRTAIFAPLGQRVDSSTVLVPREYSGSVDGISFTIPGYGRFRVAQFGWHSASNAAAVTAVLSVAGAGGSPGAVRQAVCSFRGVRRRFQRMGCTSRGVPVYDDYAHNVEKVCAALRTAQELTTGPVFAVFQPHGFGPLGFMREALGRELCGVLRDGDVLGFLPVYYAGGTTSFRPTSEEVVTDYAASGLSVVHFTDRGAAAAALNQAEPLPGLGLIMGARDPSLSGWARELVQPA